MDEDVYLLFYKRKGRGDLIEGGGKRPANSAVQISAAITAYARIHMSPYISREDCYYTDTDSIVVEKMLPKEDISQTALGKFKIEHFIKKAVFLAPKSYLLQRDKQKSIIKHKGATKPLATEEWFINQLADPELTRIVMHKNKFHKDWEKLLIKHKDTPVKMGGSSGKKRKFVFNEEKEWVFSLSGL